MGRGSVVRIRDSLIRESPCARHILYPSSLLYDGYRVSFLGLKRSRRDVSHPSPPSAKVKERVELASTHSLGVPSLF